MRLSATRKKIVPVPNDPDNGSVTIKYIGEEAEAVIEGKFMEISSTSISLKNYGERDGMFARACLDGWDNMFDEHGAVMPFNSKNVEKASNYVINIDDKRIRFFEWVNNEREIFNEEVIEQEKAALKN